MKTKQNTNDQKPVRCEGWRRRGGAFSLGPITWSQCDNDAVVSLTFVQDGKKETMPACMVCWEEAETTATIDVKKAVPLVAPTPEAAK